jgi:hypothetical protein
MTGKHYLMILAALPLLFLSCNREALRDSAGKWASVKVRSVHVAEGAPNETGTRASGGGEKRIAGKPIVQDLGGGVFAEITVEEEAAALRDGTASHALDSNSKFRVIALDGNKKVCSYADYTVPAVSPSSGEIDPDAGSEQLQVLEGQSYHFVCIAYYNNSGTWLPLAKGETLAPISISTSNDLLWESKPAPSISGSLDLSFDNLRHRLTKVQLVIDAQSASKTITGVDNDGITLGEVATTVDFDLAAGSASSITASNRLAFSGWTAGQQTQTSDWIYFFPQTTGNYTLDIAESAILLSDGGSTAAESFSIACAGFTAGSSYKIRLTLAPCGTNGVANSLKIGNGNYLTHVYGSGDSRRCWMVENSMEGTAELIYDGIIHYFSRANAAGACPSGWRLPSSDEATAMGNEVVSDKLGLGQWWVEGVDNNGGLFGYGAGDFVWGDEDRYWVTVPDGTDWAIRFSWGYYGLVSLSDPDKARYTVRCVHE